MSEARPEVTVSCNVCGEQRSPDAKICPHCKFPQFTTPCRVCRRRIPRKAKYCNECKSYQAKWLRRLPKSQSTLALIVALVSVISPAVTVVLWACHYNSHTSAILNGPPNNDKFSVTLWNTGEQPSGISRCWIEYKLDHAKTPPLETPLRVTNNAVIAPHSQTTIEIAVPDPTVRPPENVTAKLRIEVQESNKIGKPIDLPLTDDFVKAVRAQYDMIPK